MILVKTEKRQDLQGIRGLAIIAVLGFHFYPSLFPNGYLGVDQFFVLSGFLMCMLLQRSESLPIYTLMTLFYSKRFKRILPLYLLIILASMFFLYLFFPESTIENNQSSAIKSLLFVSNRPNTDLEDYFQMLNIGINIFTHTWSLSVEIQFYFIVPIIFVFGNQIFSSHKFVYYTFIGSLSLLYHFGSPPNESFNSVFARIWQFVVGMIVYLKSSSSNQKSGQSYKLVLGDEEEGGKTQNYNNYQLFDSEENSPHLSKTILKITLLGSMLIFVLSPFALPAAYLRPYFTFATGILMCLSNGDIFLSNKFLAYIGDISYSLYLIHWPIYAYWKLKMNNNQIDLFFCLIGSISLAILIFETYEKWYLKQSSIDIGFIVVILFALNVIIINKDELKHQFMGKKLNESRLDGITNDMTIDDAAILNYKWIVEDNKNLMAPSCEYENSIGPLGWCNHKGLDQRNKYKIMLFGNSWTANHARLIYEECGHKAKNMLQGAAYGCEPLYAPQTSEICYQNFTTFADRVQQYKPDYAFLLTRYFAPGSPFQKNMTSLDDDRIYLVMRQQVKLFAENVHKKLYILDALPRVNMTQIGNIVPLIKQGKTFEEINKILTDHGSHYENARRRYAKLFEDCGSKCVRIDYVPHFYNTTSKSFRFYDERGFSFHTASNHLSPRGLENIRNVYTKICNEL